MKISVSSLALLLILTNVDGLFAQESESEVKAVPVGGVKHYLEWLDQTVAYTDSAYIADIRGQLTAEFVVGADGSLTSVRIVDSLGFGVEESLRQAILVSPPWHAGMDNGIPVRTRYSMSVPVNVRQTMSRRSPAYDSFSSVARVEVFPSFVQDSTIVDSVALDAEPPGGMQAFVRWIGQNYRYPSNAVDAGVDGTLLIQFVVELDGSLSNITVVRDLGYGTGTEAVQLLKKSRRWKPGIADGKPVRTRFELPIRLLAN